MKELPSELVAEICLYLNETEVTHVDPIFEIIGTEYFKAIWRSTHYRFLRCCVKGYINAARILLRTSPYRSDPRMRVSLGVQMGLVSTVLHGHIEIVKMILYYRPKLVENSYPFRMACAGGKAEIVKYYLDIEEFDPTTFDNQGLRWAKDRCHREVVELLLADQRVIKCNEDMKNFLRR